MVDRNGNLKFSLSEEEKNTGSVLTKNPLIWFARSVIGCRRRIYREIRQLAWDCSVQFLACPLSQILRDGKKNAINVFNFSIIFVSVLKIGGHFLKKKKRITVTLSCSLQTKKCNHFFFPLFLKKQGTRRKKRSNFVHLSYFSFCLL